ncbi:MAG: hypothetical protein ACUVSW_14935 [Roseiflexus sp.]
MRRDVIDLTRLHNLVDPQEWEQAPGPGGTLEATIEARDWGLAQFIGITDHGVTVAAQHRRALNRFPFDPVLLPYSSILMKNPQYATDFEALAAVCHERAVQTIMAITQALRGEREQRYATWYAPPEDQADIDLTVHRVPGRTGVFLNTVGDIALLPRVLDAASRFKARQDEVDVEHLLRECHMTPLGV